MYLGATAGFIQQWTPVPASHCWTSQQWHPTPLTLFQSAFQRFFGSFANLEVFFTRKDCEKYGIPWRKKG
jgi:hypothetical protein